MRWLLVLVVFAQARFLPASDDAYPLLFATADTMSTATSKLPTGEMELEFHSETRDPEDKEILYSRSHLTGKVVWRGESRYADVIVSEENSDSQKARSGQGVVLQHIGWDGPTEWILTPKIYCMHLKDQHWCRFKTTNMMSEMSTNYCLALMPAATWFTLRPDKSADCSHTKILTMHPSDNRVQTTTLTPEESQPRRLQIVRAYKEKDLKTGYTVDLDQGGLVVECWQRHPEQDWYGSTWNWKQDAHAVWYVSKWTHTKYKCQDLDAVLYHSVVDVKSFNSQPKIPTDRFEFSSLKLANGTYIEKTTANGKAISYVGGKPLAKTKFDLDTLIDDAQSGFAAPTEKKP